MANTVNKVLNVAKGEVGYLEKKSNKYLNDKTKNAGSNNYTKYGAYFGINGPDAYWCDMFVDWCMVQAYGRDVAKISYMALVHTLQHQHKNSKTMTSGIKHHGLETRFSSKTLKESATLELCMQSQTRWCSRSRATPLMEQPLYQTVVLYARNPTQRVTAVSQDMDDLNMIT